MINGHGDDAFLYDHIDVNFSSNIYTHFDHSTLLEHLAQQLGHISSYPEPAPVSLERELAQRLGIQPDEVCVTHGATEAIYLAAQAYSGARSAILQPTFSEYADACRMHHHRLASIYNVEDIPTDCDILWICNPNNPTGTVLPASVIADILREGEAESEGTRRMLILDQSYAAFTDQRTLTAAEAVELGNCLMLHSMTKEYAVPGLRIGYITGPAALLEPVRRMRLPWSVDATATTAAFYLLRHRSDYSIDIASLMAERKRIALSINALGFVEAWPSDSHILLCRLRMGIASALKDYLARRHGLLIRDASNFEGLSPAFFRIAVQAPSDNDRLIRAIAQWMTE